ncbi:MAG: hypothetical protein ACREUG_08610, partial [Steroidobacteraceae bacterium]
AAPERFNGRGGGAAASSDIPALPAPSPLPMEPIAPLYIGLRSALSDAARLAASAWTAGPRHEELSR